MTHYLLVRLLLEKYGLTPDKDVTIKLVDFRNIIKEMKSGSIDAFIHPEPLPSLAEKKGVARDFILTKGLWYNHPCCVVAMNRSFFEKEKESAHLITLGTVKAGLRANDYRTRDQVIDLVQTQSPPYSKIPRQIFRKAFMPGRSDFYPFPYQSSARVLLMEMKTQGLLPPEYDAEAVARETFLSDYNRKVMTELEASGIPANNDRVETLLGQEFI